MITKNKIIGTSIPIFSLKSLNLKRSDQGTFAIGPKFLNWLHETGQNAWQILPLHETQLEASSKKIHVPSPYKSYGIGLSERFLPQSFAQIKPSPRQLEEFIAENSYWIKDYALFCALCQYFGTDDWSKWDQNISSYSSQALIHWENKLHVHIKNYITVQWQLYQSFQETRILARAKRVYLIGDMPFYLSIKSPLVWAHQNLFDLKDGKMRFVSGVPNSPTSHYGRQVWGHPLYNWTPENYQHLLSLWKARINYISSLYDILRFDHSKAFFEFGVIDTSNVLPDIYQKGPGIKVFKEMVNFSRGKGLSIFAEDAGEKLHDLRTVLNQLEIPGVKILRYAFEERQNKIIQDYADLSSFAHNCVSYTSTHDTETLLGYLRLLSSAQKKLLASSTKAPYNPDDKIMAVNLRNSLIASPAHIVIIPIQDWLLTTDRINIPGTEKETSDSNWRYVLKTPIEKLPILRLQA